MESKTKPRWPSQRQRPASRRTPRVAIIGMIAAVIVVVSIGYTVLGHRSVAPSPAIGNFQRVADPAVTPGQPVPVFFLSALYCPFCGAERWALVDALGRFGTWSNLNPSQSTAGVDGIAAVPTYDFVHAHYNSRYAAFTPRDVADAQGNPLEPLQPEERTLVNRYDPDGGIPFLMIDGAFTQLSSGYSPGLLAGKSFAQVQGEVTSNTADGQAIHHEADVITALICEADGGQPRNVCDAPSVRALMAALH
ncbi:MAG TPA: DUF929 family protein [Chloroflexota bacterium]|nr:DUF929 family protein [Chloroflexota bacterium]HVC33071.1 DUF929 family protein [Chloroflexota bacterium]